MPPVPLPKPAGLTRRQIATEERGPRELTIEEAQALADSWDKVRGDMDDVLVACTKVASAGPGDDLRELLQDLERSVERLACRRSFERDHIGHERPPDDRGRDVDDVGEGIPPRSHTQ